MLWLITDKGDQDARRLADGHYSRQKPGTRQFTRNGQNLVFITPCLRAAWVTFRPTPGIAQRADGLNAWECALFVNHKAGLSSLLIREAVALSCALWGPFPPDGFITYIKPEAVLTEIKGYCYRRAGWVHPKCKSPRCNRADLHGAHASDGKPMLRAPKPNEILAWQLWSWKGDRGGKLRYQLETI